MTNIKYTAKRCDLVYTPVQRGEVCWFAAIIMTLFFSQYMRAASFKHATDIVKKNDWRAPIANAMLQIMKNYEVNSLDKKAIRLLEPRAFLKSLRAYKPTYFDTTKNGDSGGASYGPYQHKFLAFLEIPHLCVTVPRGSTDAKYSAYNFDLPLEQDDWPATVETTYPKGEFVNTDNPEVIIIHREAGESYLQRLPWGASRPPIHPVTGLSLVKHPNTIKYNTRTYILDSCILPSYIESCSVGHAVAGITCNNGRYVYNGWAVNSGDRAMQAKITREMPCALMPADWAKDRKMCINTEACSMNNFNNKNTGKEFCFEAFRKSTVIYVREDISNSAKYVPKVIIKKSQLIKPSVKTATTTPVKPQPVKPNANKLKKLNELKRRIKRI